MEGGGSARHRKIMRQINDEKDDIRRTAKTQYRGIIEKNVNEGLYDMDYIMDNQLYLPEPPALTRADAREMELLKERKASRQQTHAEDLERTMRREQLKADLEELISCHDDPQSDDEDFLRQVDYHPRAMSRTRDFVNNVHQMIPQYPIAEDAEAEEPMLARPLPLRDQPIPPPSTRQVTSVYKRSDYADKEKESFNDRINNRANEILGWTGGLTRATASARQEARSGGGASGAGGAEGQRAFAKEMEKLLTRAETLMATEEYVPPKMKRIPPNPIKLDAQNDAGSSYGSDYGGRGGGGRGGGGWSTRSISPQESLFPRRKVVDEDIDNLFDRTAAKIQYKFDPENTKVPTERRTVVLSGNTSADMNFDWYKEKHVPKYTEEEEGLSPIQRQIRATRMAVDNSISYYKDKTSTISFADGISCDMEEKTHPEAFGIAAQRALKDVETEFKLSVKPRPDPPESASSWRRNRMEGANGVPREVKTSEVLPPPPKTEADNLVDEFLDGKLF